MSIRTVTAHPTAAGQDEEEILREGHRPSLSAVKIVPVKSLLPPDSPRTAGEDPQHAHVLAHSGAALPPIIVHRASMRVVDGAHRLRAAVERGEEVIQVRFFDGTQRDAFLIAVRENTAHGLPLSMGDRVAAAARIIKTHGHWSDRAIAEVAGLSAKTTGEIRRATQGVGAQPTARLGRDGRVRPLDSSAGRILAGRLIRETPHASLREIARMAGVSPGTVRDVRARLSRGEHPVPDAARRAGSPAMAGEPRGGGPDRAGDVRRGGGPDRAGDVRRGGGPDRAGDVRRGELSRPARGVVAVVGPGAVAGSLERSRPAALRTDSGPGQPGETTENPGALAALAKDPALKYAENGRLLLRLLSAGALPPRLWQDMGEVVPGYSVGLVSQMARASAEAWAQFADQLERKA